MYSHDKEGAFQLRGVVEGFYGRVWSMPERKHLVSNLVAKGLNHYIYVRIQFGSLVFDKAYNRHQKMSLNTEPSGVTVIAVQSSTNFAT